jgi:hypothetical protein
MVGMREGSYGVWVGYSPSVVGRSCHPPLTPSYPGGGVHCPMVAIAIFGGLSEFPQVSGTNPALECKGVLVMRLCERFINGEGRRRGPEQPTQRGTAP